MNDHALTEKPIFQALMRLAMPIVASSFFNTAYNLTDMAWIGRLGAASVAGVGSAGMFLWLSWGLCTLSRMGGQVLTAQMIGREDFRRAERYAAGAIRLMIVLGLAFSVVCLIFADSMLAVFLGSDPETARQAALYLRIVGAMQVFPFLNAVITGLFTAQGDSKTPLVANMTGLVGNMILDPVLILGIGPFPRLEVTGAALATVIAEVAATVVFAFAQHMKRKKGALPLLIRGRLAWNVYRDILRIGLPSALQSSLYCAFSMVLTSICSSFGAAAIAVMRLGGQIESVTWNAADGFGTAINAFTAQNYGALRFDRIRKGYRIAFTAVVIWGILFTIVFEMFPARLARIFFFEQDAIDAFIRYLVIVGLCEAFMSVEILAGGALAGFSETRTGSLINIILTGSRVPLAFFLTSKMGLDGVWWALSATSIAKGIVLDRAFALVFNWKKRKMASEAG